MRARSKSARGFRSGRDAFARRVELVHARRGEEDGLTIVETLVSLVIVSVVIPVALLLVTNIFQQSQNVHDTILGVQQDQTAGQALLQYLHAAIVVLPGSNATTLNASLLAGVNSSGTQTATLNAVFTNSANPKVDATLIMSLTPDGGRKSSIGTYDAVNSPTVFTYWYNNYSTTPVSLASTTTPTNTHLSEIVAVSVNVSFLAGPHKPVYGFHAVHASDFQTTIYLQNAAGAPAPTSATTVAPTGTIAVNSPLTLTATVTPVPDGGNVTFVITYGGSALSVCTAPVDVNTTTGIATCTFTPGSGGTYDVTASFSGTSDFQPSTSAVIPIVVPLATTTTISSIVTSTSHGTDTIAVTATVSPAGVTGQVEFTLQVCKISGQCTNYGSPSTLSGNSATWSQNALSRGASYTVYATYEGNSTYSASTSGTSTGTLP
jgi:hypothetical protein